MSMNKYMHPRNIYKTPPNFKQLAIDYPSFREHVKQDVSGKVTIDFKDVKALRALTCTLLKKDFNLDVEIPLNKMIPTVPLRLNYILWVEDLLSLAQRTDQVRGIDIGTGASCIYPLLAAKSKNWFMLATDIDNDSLTYAQENIQRNNLSSVIKVKHVKGDTLLKEAVSQDPEETFDFCMCNPPFFTSNRELNPFHNARRPDRPRPRNAFVATQNEVIADGGEVKFVTKLIAESKELDKKIRIYTCMVGHKSSLPPLKKYLREIEVISFKQTEFCQGHTTRWALAWTFYDIDLRKLPEATIIAAKKSKPLQHLFPAASYKNVIQSIKDLFHRLQLEVQPIKETNALTSFYVTAQSNTWSHQRRKKREQERLINHIKENPVKVEDNLTANRSECGSPEINSASELIAQMEVESPKGKKRESEDDDDEGYYNCKRIKFAPTQYCYLQASVIVTKVEPNVILEMLFLEGSAGKEGLHQILQYIKNNLKV